MAKKIFWIIAAVAIIALAAWLAMRFWSVEESVSPTPEASINAGLANPASVNCVAKGGQLETRTDATGGQYGVCLFSDGSECEEWKFFRGECQIGENKK